MAGSSTPGRLLVIEGNGPGGGQIGQLLAATPHQIDRVDAASAALAYLEKRTPEIVLLDLDLDEANIDLVAQIKELDPTVLIMVFTGQSDVATIVDAVKRGADDLHPKPVEPGPFLEGLARALDEQRLRRRVLVYREAVESRGEGAGDEITELVGTSAGIERVREAIHQVADTDASVVVLGETGTGKGLVARALHRLSGRAAASFVEVNCATLPPGLVESEIFGHEKGAFTGAAARKPGLLEIGNGGTVFLDEIAELEPQAQSKLLKAIDDRCFRHVGGVREISVDVRFIVATHQDLKKALDSGRFREDLYYRLNVFQIELPPLRERGEDILDLAVHFIELLNPILGRDVKTLTKRAADLLCNYSWPGNIRELRNVLERAMILARDKQIRPEHLPDNLHQGEVGNAPLPSLSRIEADHIRRVLDATDFNIQRSAEILGISRSTLYAKMKKLELKDAARVHP